MLSYSNIAEPQVLKIRTISTEEGATANSMNSGNLAYIK